MPVSASEFRAALRHFPAGVTVVTTRDGAGAPCGLTASAFTSVSLEPPLVGFLPGKGSTSWPRIEATGAFCVNILAADQLDVCRAFSSKDGTKFGALSHRSDATGSPIIEGVLSWIDCTIDTVADAGDHWWVTGKIEAMKVEREEIGPLQFFRGQYGEFTGFPA
jgi:flavin reductase (DIM6/NTAB) family NADH-FMN oxidoreductase RutF